MRRKHVLIVLLSTIILCIGLTIQAFALVEAGWTSKAISKSLGSGNLIEKYAISKTYGGKNAYLSFQNTTDNDIKQVRIYLKNGNESQYKLFATSTKAGSGKHLAYYSPGITFGSACRGDYTFYCSKLGSDGKWKNYEAKHTIKVYRNRTHSGTSHWESGWSSTSPSGSFVDTTAVYPKKRKYAVFTNETVYSSVQVCGGCKESKGDWKTFDLYLKKLGESSFSKVYSTSANEGSYKTYGVKSFSFTEPGAYICYWVGTRWNGTTYTGEEHGLSVSRRSANLSFADSALEKGYSTSTFTNKLTKSTTAAVSYTSSDESVAKVDENGVVTLVGMGTTTISAACPANSSYNAGAASYTLTVHKGVPKIVSKTSWSKTYGCSSFSMGATSPTDLVFSSDNTEVATVTLDGTVDVHELGTAHINIVSAGTDKYERVEKSVTIKVSLKKPTLYSKSTGKNKGVLTVSTVPGRSKYQYYAYSRTKKKYVKLCEKTSNKAYYTLKQKGYTYFKVRAYRIVDGKRVYSSYSNIKKLKKR